MKKATSATLSLILAFGIVISLSSPSIARQEEMQTVEGKIVCMEVDQEGNLATLEEFTECKGLLVLVGNDGKTYTLSGSEKEIESIAKSHETKKVSGLVEGNQRAWRLYASSLEPKESQKSVEWTVTGTIVCLIPDYARGNVKPIVATGPCNELEPHAHVIYNSEGQVYALHGSENAITKIEKNPKRRNVTLKGKVQGNQKGWVLFAE